MWFKVQNTLFSTYPTLLLLLLSAPPFGNASIFTKLVILKSEVCSLIVQLFSALWLAEYLKCVTEMLCPFIIYGNTHSISTTWWRQQYYSKNLGGVMQIFLHSDVDLWGHV